MEFEIKGFQYRTAKLTVFDQLKVSRKLLPVLAGMMGDFQTIKASAEGGDIYKSLETALPKIADALADMVKKIPMRSSSLSVGCFPPSWQRVDAGIRPGCSPI